MNMYKEDMAKALEVLARRQGLFTSYEDISESEWKKRSKKTEFSKEKGVATDDPEGPPDTKKKFLSVTCVLISL